MFHILFVTHFPVVVMWISCFNSVDATKDNGRVGRLLNHSKASSNITTKVFELDEIPRLCMFACKDVEAEEELVYDYGDRRGDIIKLNPWLAK